MSKNEAGFRNPTGRWTYEGPCSIEVIEGTPTDQYHDGAMVEGNTVYFESARVAQEMGGIMIYYGSNGQLHAGYRFLKCVRKADGSLVWRNRHYDQMR